MHLNKDRIPTQSSIGRALRAVEAQATHRKSMSPDAHLERRAQFFCVLDQYSAQIFSTVERAARRGERQILLQTIPGFGDCCDAIFDFGLGLMDADLLNEWLRDRDLSHAFHGTQTTLDW